MDYNVSGYIVTAYISKSKPMAVQKKVTIRDVAQRADVSVATISRVFNGSSLVADETRDRIQQIVEQMRYIPNASARSLSMNKTDTIGLILPEMHGEFFSEIIHGADVIARKTGYHLLVSSSHSNKEELQRTLRTMSGRVDGLIVLSPHIDEETLEERHFKIVPTVLLNSSCAINRFDTIRVDNIGGARSLTMHLLHLGHTRIAIIKGDDQNEDSEERFKGFRQAMSSTGLIIVPEYVLQGDFTEQSGYRATSELFLKQVHPTAIFAANDEMAIGVLRFCREHSIKVPEEVSVAGFDDIQIADLIHPSLTTVHVDISELGSLSFRRLLEKLQTNWRAMKQQTIVLPVSVIIRQSTAPVQRIKK